MQIEQTLSCPEAESEASVVKYEDARVVKCNIQGGHGQAVQVNHLAEGVRLGLEGELEKRSEILGRNAIWKSSSRIDRLPKYLVVQFMRFFFKATPDNPDHQGVKCKMMRPVTFNEQIDMFEFCSTRLQGILKIGRDKAIAEEDARIAAKQKEAESSSSSSSSNKMTDAADVPPPAPKNDDDDKMEEDDDEAALKAAMEMSTAEVAPSAGLGLPVDFQGKYELFAVVTHKGRDSDGGHYMGWVRQSGDNWCVFDDDEVSPCKTEDILQLKGGGDHDMAYLNFYRALE